MDWIIPKNSLGIICVKRTSKNLRQSPNSSNLLQSPPQRFVVLSGPVEPKNRAAQAGHGGSHGAFPMGLAPVIIHFIFRNFHYKPPICGVALFWNPQFTLSVLDGYQILVLDVIMLFWLQMGVNESYTHRIHGAGIYANIGVY